MHSTSLNNSALSDYPSENKFDYFDSTTSSDLAESKNNRESDSATLNFVLVDWQDTCDLYSAILSFGPADSSNNHELDSTEPEFDFEDWEKTRGSDFVALAFVRDDLQDTREWDSVNSISDLADQRDNHATFDSATWNLKSADAMNKYLSSDFEARYSDFVAWKDIHEFDCEQQQTLDPIGSERIHDSDFALPNSRSAGSEHNREQMSAT